MNSRNRTRNSAQKHRAAWYAVAICIFAIAIIILFQGFWLQVFYKISTPFVFTKDAVSESFGSFISEFQSQKSLAAENGELRQDIDNLNVALLSMQELETQNTSLEKMVGHAPIGSAKKTVVAQVLFSPPTSPYDTLIIDAGQKDGLAVGNPVFADDGTPIGTIVEIYPSFAKISLYSSPGTSLSVLIGKNALQANAIGEGAGNFSLKVPVANVPQVGDAVYLPEFEPTAIGTIAQVSFAPSDSFASILFSFPINVFTLSYVTVDTSTTIANTYAATSY